MRGMLLSILCEAAREAPRLALPDIAQPDMCTRFRVHIYMYTSAPRGARSAEVDMRYCASRSCEPQRALV